MTFNLNAANFQISEPKTGDSSKSAVQAQYASLPLAFEPNQGQVAGEAQFLVHHGQATTYFDGANTTTAIGDSHVTMSLDGANTSNFTGSDQLESKTNYFIGNDQAKWHSDIPNFKSLLAKNVYPGIDLKYYGTNSQLEHDFIVSPGTDYKQIAFHFNGQQDLSLDKYGNLILKTQSDEIQLKAPITYQQTSSPTGESKHTIPSQFKLNDNTVTVALNGEYDHSQPLIIDPVLVYSTYLGGSGDDAAVDLVDASTNFINSAIDSSGNAYIAGTTDSTNFPTSSPYQVSNSGNKDAFITKLNTTGSALIYSTYLGGTGIDIVHGIAVDTSGNAYITGETTSTNFPTSSPFQASNSAFDDAFVTKLNAAGSALTYSTYLGGNQGDLGRGIAVDSSGNAYVTGYTGSTNFPTSSPYQAATGGGTDAFLTKFNSAGAALTYSTYLGGTGQDIAYSVAIDSNGNAYIVGSTASTNFPTSSPFQASNSGAGDGFVAKFSASGLSLTYSTYLGGTSNDYVTSVVADANGNAYVTGQTLSTNFPTSSPFQASNSGAGDVFITKINTAGSALTYSTYLGGSIGSDVGNDIAIDISGNAYVAGSTLSTNFPTSSPYQGSNGGSKDAFITKLNTTGSTLIFSTYFGGSGSDAATSIALNQAGNAYIAGNTTSTNLPTLLPFQPSFGGGTRDAFALLLSENTVTVTGVANPILTFTLSTNTCDFGHLSATLTKSCVHTITAGTNAANGYVISYIPGATLTSGAQTITAMTSQTASVLGTKQFGLNLKTNTAAGSFTATDFGANPSGGVGVALTNYDTANQFKFITGGENIAQSTTPSANTAYTVSYIANISTLTAAGTYSTLMTYNIVASY
jgi:hypothetical protein